MWDLFLQYGHILSTAEDALSLFCVLQELTQGFCFGSLSLQIFHKICWLLFSLFGRALSNKFCSLQNRGGSFIMHKTWWQWSGDQEKKKDCKGGLRSILESIQQMDSAISPFTSAEGSSLLERLENLELQVASLSLPLSVSPHWASSLGFECHELFL